MSTTSFLIVPLPPSKSNPANEKALAALLSGQAKEALELSAQTKSNNANEECFFKYLNVLKALDNSPLVTEWSDPFRSSRVVESKTAYGETANTIWNFISFLQNQILSFNASSADELKKIKECVGDINALIEDLQYIVNELKHPVFTADLIHFIDVYNKYVNSLLLLSAANNSKKPQQVIRVAQASLNILRECEGAARRLGEDQKTFFLPFISAMMMYYNGMIYFEAGNEKVTSAEYGVGIAFYRRGIELMKGLEKANVSQTNVATQTKMVAAALKAAEMKATADNKRIYQCYVPEEPPGLPAPFNIPARVADPTPNLLLFITNGPMGGGYGNPNSNSRSDIDTTIGGGISVPQAPSSNRPGRASQGGKLGPIIPQNGPPQFTPSGPPQFNPQSGSPQFTPQNGPPQFTPQNGPPQFTPNGPPQFTPNGPPQFGQQFQNSPAGGPPKFTPAANSSGGPPPQFTPNGPPQYQQPQQQHGGYPQAPPQSQQSAEQVFPSWAYINNMKAGVLQRMQTMKTKYPNVAQIIDQYYQQAMIAAQSDVSIAATIQQFIQSGPNPQANITKESIESMIGQAVGFYGQLDERLDQIEQSFR